MFTFFVKNYYVLVDSTKFALHLLHYAILRLTNCYYRRNIYHVSLRNIYDMIMILSISKTPCFYLTPSFFYFNVSRCLSSSGHSYFFEPSMESLLITLKSVPAIRAL